jgi:hypothetical protein
MDNSSLMDLVRAIRNVPSHGDEDDRDNGYAKPVPMSS